MLTKLTLNKSRVAPKDPKAPNPSFLRKAKHTYLGFPVSQVQVAGLSCLKQDVEVSVGLPVSLSEPQQASARLEALVFSLGLRHGLLETLGLHCSSEGQQLLALEVDMGVAVEIETGVGAEAAAGAAPLRLRHQTLAGVSRWLCHSDRPLAAWCWAARSHQDHRWGQQCPRIPQAPCRGSWAVASRWTTPEG